MVVMQIVGWIVGDTMFWLPVVRFPVIMIGAVTAGTICDGVFDIAAYNTTKSHLQTLRRRAKRVVLVREPDAAGKGLLSLANELRILRCSDHPS